MVVVQSEHPYQAPPGPGYKYTILSQTVSVPGTTEFVVYFDQLTSIRMPIDNVAIYTSKNKTNLLFKFTSLFPGKTQPSIVIPGPSFYVEFSGDQYAAAPSYYIKAIYANNYYGFTMYVYPVMTPALGSRRTDFDSNEAGMRGGAVRD